MTEHDLIDRIYEAGAVPELWPDLLDRLCDHAEGSGFIVLTTRAAVTEWRASTVYREAVQDYERQGYFGRDDRTARLLAADHPGFLTEPDVFTAEEWEADPIRRDFLAPRGLGCGVATIIRVPTEEILVVHGEREARRGPFGEEIKSRLDRLRPHLARAMLLSSRMAFERVKGAMAALDMVGLPAAALGPRGTAVAMNPLMEALVPQVAQPRRARFVLTDPGADRLLGEALSRLDAGGAWPGPRSIAIPATERHVPMVAHLHPISRSAHDLFGTTAAVLIVTPFAARELPPADVIQALFDLTPAEARIAKALGDGRTIAQTSSSTGNTTETIRQHVKSIFNKTGVHRQAELVGLLQGLAPRQPAGAG